MKILLTASATLAALIGAAPAMAQDTSAAPSSFSSDLSHITTYGTLGYSHLSGDHVDLDGVQGRVGARFGRYLGVEADATSSFDGDHTVVAGDAASIRLRDQYAGYAVGYLPLAPNADLFARVGYGHADFGGSNYVADTTYRFGHDSVNYGVGGQYFYQGGPNGIRADYTRYDYQDHAGSEDVASVAYVRKFQDRIRSLELYVTRPFHPEGRVIFVDAFIKLG